jgi:hypothetical protein
MFDSITGLVSADTMSTADVFTFLVLLAVMFLFGIGLYVYSALALMKIARKAKAENPWLAWIPVANLVLIANIAGMHWWPLLLFIPYFLFVMIGIFVPWMMLIAAACILFLTVMMTVWQWKMFVAVKRPGWWAIVGPVGGILGVIVMAFEEPLNIAWPTIIGMVVVALCTIISLILWGIAAWGKDELSMIRMASSRTAKKKIPAKRKKN